MKNDDLAELGKKIDALELTVESKNKTIENLKESVIQAEIKARRLLEQVSKAKADEAQVNIDNTMKELAKRMGQANPGRQSE